MGSADLITTCLNSIRQISEEMADAVVYLDAGCAEAFQFIGAFPLLLELGVRAVCSLENMSPLDAAASWNPASLDPAEKMVLLTSRLLSDAHRYILRCLSSHQKVLSCNIYTSISEVAHSAYADSPLGPDAYQEYQSLLLQDYEELSKKVMKETCPLPYEEKREGDLQSREITREVDSLPDLAFQNINGSSEIQDDERYSDGIRSGSSVVSKRWHRLVISVNHFPLILCPVCPRVFVFPSESTIGEACLSNNNEDALSPGLPAICTGSSHVDDVPTGATLTAHFLYHLAAKMDIKLEIFSLGDLSKAVGKIMTDMSSLYDVGRRKRSAGLLLIDRSLDLLTPCCHGDSLVDRILSSLPRKKRTPLHGKFLHIQNKHAQAEVERPSLDLKVPLEDLRKKEISASSIALSESIKAMMSGWNSSCTSQDIGSVDCMDNYGDNGSMEDLSILSGSLIENGSYNGANYMEALLDRKSKDAALLIKKWLMESIRHDKMLMNRRSHMGFTAPDLQSTIEFLSSEDKFLLKHRGILQLAVATVTALSEPHSSHWDAFVSAERILRINAGDTSQSLSSQIRDLINTSSFLKASESVAGKRTTGGLLSFEDALLLAIIGYILAGENFPTSGYNSPFSWQEEHSLKEAVVDAILDMPVPPKLGILHGLETELEANLKAGKQEGTTVEASPVEDFDDQWDSWGDEDDLNPKDEHVYGNMQLKLELRDRVDSLFKSFHKFSGMKWKNPISRGQIGSQSSILDDSPQNKGFLSKILSSVLAKYDIPGMVYHSSAVGRLLKSGFGRFGIGQSKPVLADQNMLIVFVMGGINGTEVFEAQEAVSQSGRPDLELVLGGTTLLTPSDMFDLLLGSSSYV